MVNSIGFSITAALLAGVGPDERVEERVQNALRTDPNFLDLSALRLQGELPRNSIKERLSTVQKVDISFNAFESVIFLKLSPG